MCNKDNINVAHTCATCINNSKGVEDHPCWSCVHNRVGAQTECFYRFGGVISKEEVKEISKMFENDVCSKLRSELQKKG